MARLVVTRVSQATRLVVSCLRQKSRTASEIWSATLSGWPMETDSLVNRKRSLTADSEKATQTGQLQQFTTRSGPIVLCRHAGAASCQVSVKESKPSTWMCVYR